MNEDFFLYYRDRFEHPIEKYKINLILQEIIENKDLDICIYVARTHFV
jgi:hypothetical protein